MRNSEQAAAADYAFAKLRGEIAGTYAEAERDLAAKLAKFAERYAAQDTIQRAKLAAGEITQSQYESWVRGQVFRGDRWKAVRQSCVDQIHRANQTATDALNGRRRALFQQSANYSAYQIERGTRGAVNFALHDSATVTRLLRDNPKMLPDLKIGKRKDDSWNGRGIQNAITQGIIQGEGIPDIAKRIAKQTGERNRAALTRQARTAMTGAQNAGRVQAMHEAEEMGVKVKKRWIATLDKKTRDAHAELDGQEVDADEPFVVNGMEIMYPGDPNADPSLVYNCRCTIGWVYPDHPAAMGSRRDNETGEVIEGQTYRQWEAGKQEEAAEEPAAAESTAPARFAVYEYDSYDTDFRGFMKLIDELQAEKDRVWNDRSISTHDRFERINEISREKDRLTGIVRDRYAFEGTAMEMQYRQVPYNPIQKRGTEFDEAAVIQRIAGGDQTKGSCASAAFCYVGQLAGYDVLDFRDGDSREVFSTYCAPILRSMGSVGEGTYKGVARSYKVAGRRALEQAVEGKTYYFECARHAAIVRRHGGELEYLELQSGSSNGWKPFSKYGVDETLRWRFGSGTKANGEVVSYMVDVESMAQTDRFLKILGYLNTAESEQKKGAGGHER